MVGSEELGQFPPAGHAQRCTHYVDIQANFVLVCTRSRKTPAIILYNRELTWYFHPRWLLSCFDILTKLTLNKHCRNHRTRSCPPLAQDSPQIRCDEPKLLDPLSQECPILTKDFKATSCWLIRMALNYWPPFKRLWSRLPSVLKTLLYMDVTAAYIKCHFCLFSSISVLNLS